MNERLSDLHKYYKQVRACILCGIKYGTDCIDDGVCPICQAELEHSTSRFAKGSQYSDNKTHTDDKSA